MCVWSTHYFFLQHGKVIKYENYYFYYVWGVETEGLVEMCPSLSMTQHRDQSVIFGNSSITNCLPIQNGLRKSSNRPTSKTGAEDEWGNA